MPNSVRERVIDVIQQAVTGEINESTTFEELGVDSLDRVEMIMELEEEFDLDVPDDLAADFRTVKDVIDYVTKVESEN